MPKFRIHEFYGFTKTYEVEAENYDDAWDLFYDHPEQVPLIHDGRDEPELHSQECEDVTEYA